MRVLTVKQPWAWGLIFGPKRVENRSWDTAYRGPLLIHAGKSRSDLDDARDLFPDLPLTLDFGAILGVVDLVDCVPFDRVRDDPFAEGPWCWITTNPRPLPQSHPCNGALGLWVPPKGLGLSRL